VKKIVYRMFGADPGGDDFSAVRWRKSAWLLADESGGASPLFGEVGIFAKLCIVAGFFETSDALDAVDGMGSKRSLLPIQSSKEGWSERGLCGGKLRSCEWSREGSTAR